jgi:hypothetical protein
MMNPSHKRGFVQIFFVMRRESRVVETNPTSDLYVVTAWITYGAELNTIDSQFREKDGPFAGTKLEVQARPLSAA